MKLSYISIVAFTIVAGIAWFLHPLASNAQEVTTVAGDGTRGFLNGVGTAARFDGPYGVAVQGDSLYVADLYNHRIRQIILSTGEVTTVAGDGTSGYANIYNVTGIADTLT